MIWYARLSNCCLAPVKLKEQFQKVHGDRKCWNTTLAEFKMKRARLDENATLPVFGFVLIDKSILTASYEVAYLLHTIGEKLVKPAVLKKANIIFGKAVENKSSQILLFNGTISNKIDKFKIHSFFW